MLLQPNAPLHDGNIPAFPLNKAQFVCGAIMGYFLVQAGKALSASLAVPFVLITTVQLVKSIICRQVNSPSLLAGLLAGGVFANNLLGFEEISNNLRPGLTVPKV